MKNEQPIHAAEDLEIRALTDAEVIAVAGGPQVVNDGPSFRELTESEIVAVAGGPQVQNDGPPN